MKNIKGLDSLRFFAFLAIFIFHATSHFKNGYLGVDFFFVLSSFLLTYLAYEEMNRTSYFSKKKFIIRRILRIFPLYYLIIIISFTIIPIIDSSTLLPSNKILYWLFLSNYDNSDCIYALKFLWSIAVEEQFYLLFIGLSFLLMRKVMTLVLMLLFAYFSFKTITTYYNISIYNNTINHFPDFACGIIGGYIFYHKKEIQKITFLLFIFSLIGNFSLKNDTLLHVNNAILFLSLIFIVIRYAESLSNFLLFKLTEKLGKYTFGLYVYSGFVLSIFPKLFIVTNPYISFTFKLFVLLIISMLSYHLFEKHFIRLKKHFE